MVSALSSHSVNPFAESNFSFSNNNVPDAADDAFGDNNVQHDSTVFDGYYKIK